MEQAIAVIQARMESTRLPGKMLMDIAGMPLMGHVICQLQASKTISKIIVATSTSPADDRLAAYVSHHFNQDSRIAVMRGDQHSVLSRFTAAATKFPATYMVRICGDIAIADGALIDAMLDDLSRTQADYLDGMTGKTPLYGGIEPIRTTAFWRMVDEAGSDPIALEHVTGWLNHAQPHWLKRAEFRAAADYYADQTDKDGAQPTAIRLWVDSQADLDFIRALYTHSKAQAGALSFAQIKKIISKHPELLGLNQMVRQKTVTQKTRRLLLVAEAGHRIGIGHLKRITMLAQQLINQQGCGVHLLIAHDGIDLADTALPYDETPLPITQSVIIDQCRVFSFDGIVLDVQTPDLLLDQLHHICPNLPIILIDDGSARNLNASLSFLPPLAQLPQHGKHTKCHSGMDWMILPAMTKPAIGRSKLDPDQIKLLITMGGADPSGLSLRVLTQLSALQDTRHLDIKLVIGKAMTHRTELENMAKNTALPLDIIIDPDGLADLLDQADIILCRFGITAYEAHARNRVQLCWLDGREKQDAMISFNQLGGSLFAEDHPDWINHFKNGQALSALIHQQYQSFSPHSSPHHHAILEKIMDVINS
ncbi:MAG: hypothetical protein AB8B77_08890 [Alphaproteobacteria bacterium]